MRRFALLFFVTTIALGGEWGSRGITKRFVPHGGKVFAADGRGVAIYDVSRSPIQRDAVVETGAESLDITFLNDHEIAVGPTEICVRQRRDKQLANHRSRSLVENETAMLRP